MLTAVPRHWYSWDFAIEDKDAKTVAAVHLSSWRDRGTIVVGDAEYSVERDGLLTGAFMLKHDGSIVAQAQKPSVFRRAFTVEYEARHFIVKSKSIWRRGCVVLEGQREVGTILPQFLFGRRAIIDLPDDEPLVLRSFIVWLALLLWKRDSDTTAVIASGS
jgi:hypothetical protein